VPEGVTDESRRAAGNPRGGDGKEGTKKAGQRARTSGRNCVLRSCGGWARVLRRCGDHVTSSAATNDKGEVPGVPSLGMDRGGWRGSDLATPSSANSVSQLQ